MTTRADYDLLTPADRYLLAAWEYSTAMYDRWVAGVISSAEYTAWVVVNVMPKPTMPQGAAL
jgi:hypothetical protein